MKLSSLFLLAAVVHGKQHLDAAMNFIKPLNETTIAGIPTRLLRGLQPPPPSTPPSTPGFPEPGEVASYCDFFFLFFEAQADHYGYDCDCETDDEKDTVTCESRNMNCDSYNVGDVQVICHYDHFSASTTKGPADPSKIFDFQACAEYSDERYAPEPLVGTELCFDYKLTFVWGEGYTLDECGLTWTTASEKKQVCMCAICYTSVTVGALYYTYLGLGLDCQESVIPGIILVECQAITDKNPAVIPLIQEYKRQDTDTTDSPPLTTVAPASTQVTATVASTQPATVASTQPATTAAAEETTTNASTEPATTDTVAETTTTVASTEPATTVASTVAVTTPGQTTGVADAASSTTDAPVTTDSPTPTSASMQVKVITMMLSLFLSFYSAA